MRNHPTTASAALAAITFLTFLSSSLAGILSDPVNSHPTPLTVPSLPLQTDSSQLCHLDLSDELFGGVNEACGHNLDRSRCCPVLAAWLYAAHARSALQIGNSSISSSSSISEATDLPMLPDDESQKCVDTLQKSLLSRKVRLPQPNATCDAVLCFCGIRLHQISSLRCPTAFSISDHLNNSLATAAATPTGAVKNLERSCRNSSYSGCSKCLGALQKVNGANHNRTDRASQMFNRDCQLMGLTWLLAINKTTYIPTVSAVLRAVMYSPHPHEAQCSPDQENMPLAVDSLLFEKSESSSPSISKHNYYTVRLLSFSFPILPLLMLRSYFVLFI